MSTDTDVSTLNSLIKGFEEAAENVDATRFSSQFREFAQERRQVVTTLQTEVRRLGGNPEDDSSFLAAAHRTFMNLKDAVTGRDDKAIVEEVERGEDYIKEKYQAALSDTDLSPEVRQVIEQAYQSIRRGHDRASQLKHSLQGQGSY